LIALGQKEPCPNSLKLALLFIRCAFLSYGFGLTEWILYS